MKKIHGILFDCDGTLFSSLAAIHESVNYCLARQGVEPVSRDTVRRLSCMSLPAIDAALAPIVDIEKFNADYWERERSHHVGEQMLFVQETRPLLDFLKKSEIKTAVVTTREHGATVDLLAHHDLLGYFDVIIGRDDVDNPKPHPEPVLKACDVLSLTPCETLFVGDTMNDLRAAKDAGSTFVGVLTGANERKEFEKAKADYIVEHAGIVADLIRE